MAIATTTALSLAALGAGAGSNMYNARQQRKAAEKARELSPLGQQAAQQMMAQGGLLNKEGGGLLRTGAGYTRQGMQDLTNVSGYYNPLLRGDRAAIDQTLAPETAAITDVYRGGARALDRSGVRGAQRDMAQADMIRDRTGQLALLRPQARAAAAGAMTGIGQARVGAGLDTTRTGAGLMGEAGDLFGRIYGGERGSGDSAYAADAAYRGANAEAFGRGSAGLVFDIMKGLGQPKAPGGGWTPPFAGYPTAPGQNRPFGGGGSPYISNPWNPAPGRTIYSPVIPGSTFYR